MNNPHSLSPAGACQLLECFVKKQVTLTVQQYDNAFDTITELLGSANDEVYRLTDYDPKEQR